MRAASLAILAGVLFFLGFIGFGIWPLVFVFPAVLLLALEGAGPGRAFLLGTLTGFTALCGGYYWVVHLLVTFAGLSTPLAVLGYALLNVYQGLPWGIAAALVVWGGRRLGGHPAWLLPPAVVAVEGVFPVIFPSFAAAALLRQPHLTQIADLGGAYLVDALIMLVGGGLYAALRARRPTAAPTLAAAASVLLALVYGAVRIAQVDAERDTLRTIDVALVQANLGSEEKTTRRYEFLERHQTMSREVVRTHPEVDLIVWPESAFNRALDRRRPEWVKRFIVKDIPRPVLSGAITVDYRDGERFIFNSAVLTSSTGAVRGYYDKVRLVYFGETIPLVDRLPFLKAWFPRTGSFDRGTTLEHLELDDGTRLLPLICFEDLLPSLVHQLWRADGPPEVLVNVTNDSWYGDTHEPLIHLALASLRSIETRRALIRSTNTGISAIVDRAGRIAHRTGQWTREVLVAEVPLVEDGRTTLYVAIGDWPVWLSIALWAGFLVLSLRARRRART